MNFTYSVTVNTRNTEGALEYKRYSPKPLRPKRGVLQAAYLESFVLPTDDIHCASCFSKAAMRHF